MSPPPPGAPSSPRSELPRQAPVSLKILASITDVSAAEWDGLVGAAAPPFLRHGWLAAMEESGSASPENGWSPRHLTLWQGGRLLAASPAYVKAHSLGEYIYDFGWAQAAQEAGIAYYPKLVLGAPLSPATAPRLIVAEDAVHPQALRRTLWESAEALAREEGCSGVHVLFCSDEEAAALEDAGWARRLTLQFHWHNPGYRSLDDYLQRFDSKRRNQLKRELRAPEAQGLTLRTVRGEALGPEHARAAHDFYVHTCEQFAWGRVQLNRNFFERAFRDLPGQVELVEALRGSRRIAGAFNLAHEGILYGRYWGAIEEVPFLHFNVCLYHSVEESIRLGRRRFEPGAGGEHKVSRGFVPSAIHSAHRLFDPSLDDAVRRFLRRETLHHRAAISEGETLAGLKPWRP